MHAHEASDAHRDPKLIKNTFEQKIGKRSGSRRPKRTSQAAILGLRIGPFTQLLTAINSENYTENLLERPQSLKIPVLRCGHLSEC